MRRRLAGAWRELQRQRITFSFHQGHELPRNVPCSRRAQWFLGRRPRRPAHHSSRGEVASTDPTLSPNVRCQDPVSDFGDAIQSSASVPNLRATPTATGGCPTRGVNQGVGLPTSVATRLSAAQHEPFETNPPWGYDVPSTKIGLGPTPVMVRSSRPDTASINVNAPALRSRA